MLNPDTAETILNIEVGLFNALNPTRPLYLSKTPPGDITPNVTSQPSSLQKPSVLLGMLGTVASAILAHPKVGAIGMDTGILSGILSLGTAAIGSTGGWGLALNALRTILKV